MGMKIGGDIITDGLIFYADASNKKSHLTGSAYWDDIIGEVRSTAFKDAADGDTTFPVLSSDAGGCFKFTVANISGLVATASLSFPNDTITMEAWFRLDADNQLGNNPRVIELWQDINEDQTSSDPYDGHALNVEPDRSIRAWTNEGPGTSSTNRIYQYDSVTAVPVIGNWYHWVVTHDGSTGNVWWNGNNIDTTVVAGGVRDCNRITIGNMGPWYATHMIFDMSIAIVRIYDVVLTYEQVLNNFHMNRARFGV